MQEIVLFVWPVANQVMTQSLLLIRINYLMGKEKKEIWETGHRGSIGWLFASGRLKVVEPSKYD